MYHSRDEGDIFLIDEPELHLNWSLELKLFEYFKYFCQSFKKQIIAATHSTIVGIPPFISLTTFLGRRDGKIIASQVMSNEMQEELLGKSIRLASSMTASAKLAIYSEGNNISYIEKAISMYAPALKESIKVVDELKDKTSIEQLAALFKHFQSISLPTPILFVWDCDAENKVNDLVEGNNVFKYVFKQNPKNTHITKGIENLFPKTYFLGNYYKNTTDGYGAKIQKFDKQAFQKNMLTKATVRNFVLFRPLIQRMRAIIK